MTVGCAMVLSKTLYSHSASLHSGAQLGNDKFNAGGNPAMEWHLNQGGIEILAVASCYRNRDKLRPDGPLNSNAVFTAYNIAMKLL